MGRQSGMRGAWLGALLSVAVIAAPAFAEVTTERPGSIVLFPKVLVAGTIDTLIQLSNISNSLVHVHCFYVDGSLEFPDLPPSQDNQPRWQEVDFDIWLTKQQPTHWVASTGRRPAPLANECTETNSVCNDAGLFPGRIPPLADGFTGELKCIEVDSSGAPISGNHLKGEVTLVSDGPFTNGDASKYNALAVVGLDSNDADNTLCLGGGVTTQCPRGAEYDACPQVTLLDSFSVGANNPQLGPNSSVSTELTIMPCTEDFERQQPGVVTVQFQVTNEFEEIFSASTKVTCWSNFNISTIRGVFDVNTTGTRFLQTRMAPATNQDSGFVGVVEETHRLSGTPGSRAAFNLFTIGERSVADVITLPEGP
ncbi:MAG TPA: hypothetical protein VL403_12050 [Candidatus Kryptonia bacterium]|nr:hypothetical protein [Candidatus Kryptonia bacterium]